MAKLMKGQVVDGYQFQGGDPNDQNSWKKVESGNTPEDLTALGFNQKQKQYDASPKFDQKYETSPFESSPELYKGPQVKPMGPVMQAAYKEATTPYTGAQQTLQAAPAGQDSWLATGPSRFLKGMKDPIDAGAQMLPRGLQQVTSLFGAYPNDVSNWLGNQAKSVDQGISQSEQQYQAARQAAGQKGVDWYRAGGNVVPTTAAIMAGGGIPTAQGLLGRMGIGALSGTALGAFTPIPENTANFAAEKAKQMAVGGAVGTALPVVANAAAGIIKPAVAPAIDKLRSLGIFPTPGQVSGASGTPIGNFLSGVEEKAQSIPLLGDIIKSSRKDVAQEFNDAAWNKALSYVGDKLPKGSTGRDAAQYVDDSISSAYDKAVGSIKPFTSDPQLMTDLGNGNKYLSFLPKGKAQQYVSIIKQEVADRMNGGQMTGDAFKSAESNLSNLIRQYQRDPNADNRLLGQALRDAQASVRDWLARSPQNPQASAALAQANSAYATALRPLRASANLWSDEGIFTPRQFLEAVKYYDPSRNKKSFATQGANMQDLADTAKSVLGDKVPDSGTTARAMLAYLAANPLKGAGVLAASLPTSFMYSGMGRRLGARGPMAGALADQVRKLGPYGVPAGMSIYEDQKQ